MDNLTSIRKRSNIEKTIYDFFKDNYQEDMIKNEETPAQALKKANTLCRIAYEMAIEEESNFRDDDEYLNSLIQKAIVKYTLNPNIELFDKKELSPDEAKWVIKHLTLHLEICELIRSNNTLWNMVKDDKIKLKNIILHVIKKNVDNIDNLTQEDKETMVQDVLMEYLTVD